jgi:hypothetical protein
LTITFDDHLVLAELHEVEAAEDRRVLVLGAAFQAEVLALHDVGEPRLLVVGERRVHVRGEQADQGDDDGRGGPEPGARRGSAVQEEVEAVRRISGDLLDRGFDEVEAVAVGTGLLQRDRRHYVEIKRLNADLPVLAAAQGSVGVAVDGRAEDQTSLLCGVGGNVGAATGEADPQRSPRTQQGPVALLSAGHRCEKI